MESGLTSVRVQVVLFRPHLSDLWRLVPAIAAAARDAIRAEYAGSISLALGDCSPRPTFAGNDMSSLEAVGIESGLSSVSYEYFNANLGSSGGSNRLAERCTEEFILILNPDTYPAPTMLSRMLALFHDPSVGAVDAHQIPLDHPKDYDPVAGDTSWLSGSCLLVRRDVFEAVSGFDSEHFFLYCDDVDFSWRIRLRGHRTLHEPRAVVFHDKRIGENGHIVPTSLERFYGVLGRLMLAYKYDRQDVLTETIASIELGGSPEQRAALEEWRRRQLAQALPPVLSDAESVAQFIDGEYARHRF